MCRKVFFLFSLVLLLSMVLSSAADAATPIGWWKFDEGTGTTAKDSSGLGNDGTFGPEGTPTWVDGVKGGTDRAVYLDGSDDYININAVANDMPANNNFSISAWIMTTTGDGNVIGSNDSGSGHDFIFGLASNGYLLIEADSARNYPPALNDGGWHMITYVRNGTTAYLYSDGVEVGTETPSGNPVGQARWSIGQEWDSSPSDEYQGAVDEIRFYNVPLSATDVASLYKETRPAFLKAYDPVPADGATYTDTWVSLGWSAGDTAASHDVYMSENKDEVTTGAAAAFRGNQSFNFFLAGLGMPGDPYPAGLTPGATYYWRVDEVEANGTTKHAGSVWSFSIPPKKAYNPNPRNGGKYVPLDTKLTWTAGFGTKLNTVYFGTSLDTVSNATTGGAQQGTTTYTPAGPLAKGTTYYWRVDEFDGQTTYKGDVWSFTAMADITITNPDLVGWWTFDEGTGNKAIDFSGHGNDATFGGTVTWVDGKIGGGLSLLNGYVVIDGIVNDLAGTNLTLSVWVKTTQPGEGNVFAANDSGSGHPLMFGIDGGGTYVNDGSDTNFATPLVNDDQWHMITYVRNGSTGYIYVDGVQAGTYAATFALDSVTRWSIGQEWDDTTPSDFYMGAVDDARVYKKALSADEIKQIMRGDPLLAWKPSPDNRSTVDVEKAKSGVSWSAGDTAAQHDVYFGTDQAAVAGATAADTTGVYRGRRAQTSYVPTEVLAWGSGPYYWRVDEVKADGTITAGPVWSFSVANYLAVDDFEAYNDIDEKAAGSNRIYLTWVDGYGTTTNGAVVGNLNPPFAETRRAYVHGGSQAMPMAYDNNRKSSQAVRTLTAGKDWTRESVVNLSLWFRGDTTNAAERLYVSINGKAPVYHTNANAAQLTTYTEWVIPLSTFSGQGTTLNNITSITIGLGTPGNTTVAGGTGVVYVDDIRLTR